MKRALAGLLFGAAGACGAAQLTPSGPTVPENLLRIELRLDAPARAPLDPRFVKLYDESGHVIDDAFLDLALPDRDGRTIALLLHPGRIKTGVGPNLALGPALRQGQLVRLAITDPGLGQPVYKQWRVTAAVRQAIAPADWKLEVPPARGLRPLTVAMAAPLSASSEQLIAVGTADGARLPGRVQLFSGESHWRFTPASPWTPGRYFLRIHPSIEDPAGNRLCSAFEQAGQSQRACDDEVTIAFSIQP
ncbi:hypothetical protein [Rugamonas sp.]|uniref:hypothetical protein n=1 Tax=Rugamonas sp. TaxID=1926287 RepID=UPI0025FF7A72|nr:hypothetical protein [Rugamonas sp.]